MLETLAVSKENCIQAAVDGDANVLRRYLSQLDHGDGMGTGQPAKDDGRSPEDTEAGSSASGFLFSELCSTLFREAIENGQLEFTRVLLEAPKVKQLCSDDPRLLSQFLAQAIVEDYSEIVECLLKHGADPNRPLSMEENDEELPALSLASRLGSLEIAELLVSKGAIVAARQELTGATALHEAAMQDEDELIEFLVKSGAYINATDDLNGETALHVAVKKGNRKAVEALIKCRANLNIPNKRGSCAVHIATVEAQPTILALLATAGADTATPKTPRRA